MCIDPILDPSLDMQCWGWACCWGLGLVLLVALRVTLQGQVTTTLAVGCMMVLAKGNHYKTET